MYIHKRALQMDYFVLQRSTSRPQTLVKALLTGFHKCMGMMLDIVVPVLRYLVIWKCRWN